MIILSTTGRCGTMAISEGISKYTNAKMEHETEPRLLYEGFLKHINKDYKTELFQRRLSYFAQQDKCHYGHAFRSAPLLDDLAEKLPEAKFVLIFRSPIEYVASALSKNVMQRGDEWDVYRVFPLEIDLSKISLPEKIALHWNETNNYLLDFYKKYKGRSMLLILGDLTTQIHQIIKFAGFELVDPKGLRNFLIKKPNSAKAGEYYAKIHSDEVQKKIDSTWEEIQRLANQQRSDL